ncbi:hypothetical protein VKT23_006380 [Stygiomarasmius scandens]|uniref:BTB domain-containing protein n=1 Tax=Marasmiellus scandens TaxID=2682957 RepID=A0ABR1JNF6_9AGAR
MSILALSALEYIGPASPHSEESASPHFEQPASEGTPSPPPSPPRFGRPFQPPFEPHPNQDSGIKMEPVSDTFHADSGGDITFRSSDGVLFYIKQKYLEAHAEGFPLAEHTAPQADTVTPEQVPLAEDSTVLELLFQFVYPRMPPDLDDLEFPALMGLAEAAEKYFVHHARKFCLMRIRYFIPEHPREILTFAAEHSHDDLLYEIAPKLVFHPLYEMLYLLPSSLQVPWSMYHDQCTQKLFHLAVDHFEKSSSLECKSNNPSHNSHWRDRISEWKLEISYDISVLADLDELLFNHNVIDPNFETSPCCTAYLKWRDQLKNIFVAQMRSLESFRKMHRMKMTGRVLA